MSFSCTIINVTLVFKVEVLSSLQKPKKITANASDGKSYILLCKPKVRMYIFACSTFTPCNYIHFVNIQDDLRKDARLMEFNSVINKVLYIILCKFSVFDMSALFVGNHVILIS